MIRFSDYSKHVYAYDATGKKLRAEYHTPIQPYKYNGKKLDRHHGLDWLNRGKLTIQNNIKRRNEESIIYINSIVRLSEL